MSIINDRFMLKNETAVKLYEYAKDMPIIDYHCHLNPQMIASDYRFRNLADLLLGGDHYKWRQMRTYGVDEFYITGGASDYEKFQRFAEVVPFMIGNPIYHWTHLELKRYFDVDEALTPESAERIWNHCNALLASDGYTAKGLIERSNVKVLCTTDDPADDLRYHKEIKESGFCVKVLPTFRPDKVLNIDKETFLPYMQANGLKSFAEVRAFICEKVKFFHENGCRLSDHALDRMFYKTGDAEAVFNKAMRGEAITDDEAEIYKTDLLLLCAKCYTEAGWTMQLHIGALRNNNARMYRALGPDVGFDSINDGDVAEQLSALLNAMDEKEALPKTILYNLNPKDNYVLATMLGNFQAAPFKGKLQFGSGWWFNDQRDGMEAQLRALANLSLLPCFVGMLTDSRSFVSYPRHEYFRRILCNLLGTWVEDGEYPADFNYLEKIVKDVCFCNADSYFGFDA
ncbi:MAG: glucuronate isomerase [Ruminococcaceae bacterium]|nr:glucuronate isomerase [Oscillospiraceae bacterium]